MMYSFRPLPYVVRLRGVPFSCSERDVIEFFRPLHIEFRDIYLCADTRGRFTGEGRFFDMLSSLPRFKRSDPSCPFLLPVS